LHDREASAPAVVLPNQKTLIAGGSSCFPMTFGPGGLCGPNSFQGFECGAFNNAELYSEDTSTFTLAGAGNGGTMVQRRSGSTATLISGSGTALDGKVLITGGSGPTGGPNSVSFLSLNPPPPGCAPSGLVAQDTAEIYDPVADTFTATGSIPGCAAGTAPPACTTGLPATCAGPTSPITSTSEIGTNVTITSAANPTGLIVGDKVTIAGVSIAGYNGIFVVTGIPTGTTFTYASTAGLGAGTGGFAAADTAQCGLVNSAAVLLNDGRVLVAGGDYVTGVDFIVPLGQSSKQAFIFNPGTATFTQTASMIVPRELPGIAKLPSGEVLVAGGLTSAAAACASAAPVAFTTNSSAETYDPTVPSWTLTAGSSATPGAAGGMKVKRIAPAYLFKGGSAKAGLAILAGGVDVETSDGTTPNFPACEPIANIQQTTLTASDLFDESTDTFAATGALNQSRGGYILGDLVPLPVSADFLVIGGECAIGSLASAAIGTTSASGLCGAAAKTDYYELYSSGTGTWAVGAALPASTPANGATSAFLP